MTLDVLLQGLMAAFSPTNLAAAVAGLFLGAVLGGIPGLTAIMGIALLLPVTLDWPLSTSVIMLLAALKGGLFGGSISAILIATPGTPAAGATLLDGYPMSRKGQAGKALRMALVSSWWGETLSTLVVVLCVFQLARYALLLGPAEYTIIVLFALTTVASLAGRSMVKGIISGVLGMIVAVVGLDTFTATSRFTFGVLELSAGIDELALLIGLLAFPEVLNQMQARAHRSTEPGAPPVAVGDSWLQWRDIRRCLRPLATGGVIGTVIGAIPGLGPTTSTFMSYDRARNSSKDPESFGKGNIEGVAAAESANSATNGGAMLSLLALGIPGDIAIAVLMGAFIIKGIAPGPTIFEEHPDEVATIFGGMIVANFLMLIVFYPLLGALARITRIRASLMLPSVLVMMMVGTYATNQRFFDVWVMLAFGVLGWVMLKYNFSPVALLVGFILGPIFEDNFRRALVISEGSFAIFFDGWLVWGAWLLTVFSVFAIIRGARKRRRVAAQSAARRTSGDEGGSTTARSLEAGDAANPARPERDAETSRDPRA